MNVSRGRAAPEGGVTGAGWLAYGRVTRCLLIRKGWGVNGFEQMRSLRPVQPRGKFTVRGGQGNLSER
ncbi:hypothetical protein CS0771_04860 [Catellatospora sp. IY07-71]|nr:hypothetical protein CS0771_04860 [Catellatospora sp. IY07-71]